VKRDRKRDALWLVLCYALNVYPLFVAYLLSNSRGKLATSRLGAILGAPAPFLFWIPGGPILIAAAFVLSVAYLIGRSAGMSDASRVLFICNILLSVVGYVIVKRAFFP
jgi:hypothetical protein